MSSARLARRVRSARAARDGVRGAYRAQLAAIRGDYAQRGIKGRVADEVSEQAHEIMAEAAAVLEHHPGAVGGTIVALGLWLLRNPIIAGIGRLLGVEPSMPKETDDE